MATRHVIAMITKLFCHIKDWFFNLSYESEQAGWRPNENQLKVMREKIQYDQRNVFYQKLDQTLGRVQDQWSDNIKKQLSDQITNYLQLPTLEERDRERRKARDW